MRNLKRALSLALASVMLLGMMVVGTSASYADVTSKQNKEAIEVAQAVGVMIGDDKGNFNPDKAVTRNEMAVIMTALLDLKTKDYAGSCPLTDVPAWAEPYVAACYANGIVAGTSATTYSGDATVTAAQAALMMQKALGYFQYASDFGEDWVVSTVKQASKIDLFKGIDVSASAPLTRNDVAQLALNTLKATTVDAEDNGIGLNPNGQLVSKYKYVEVTKDASKYTKISGENYASGTKYTVELGEDLYDGKLELDATTSITDDFGRPCKTWKYDSKDVFASVNDAKAVFTADSSASDVVSALKGYKFNGTELKDKDTKIGSTTTAISTVLTFSAATDKIAEKVADLTDNGKVVEFYADSNKNINKIVVIEYTFDKVTNVSTNNKGKTTYTINSNEYFTGDANKDDTAVLAGKVEKNDYVTYVIANNKCYIYPTTSFEGKMTKYNTSNKTMTVAGTTYETSAATASTLTQASSFTGTDNSKFYVDQFGFVVAVDGISDTQYAVIDSIAYVGGTGVEGKGYAEARLVFVDGTTKIVKVKTIDGKTPVTALSGTDAEKEKQIVVSATASANSSLLNKIYKYSISSEKYVLTTDNTVAGGDATLKKGNPTVVDGKLANNSTIYVVKTKDGDDNVWTVYNGYRNMPTMSAAGKVDAATDDGDTMFVYVDATNTTVGDTTSDVVFLFNNEYTVNKEDKDNTYYEYTVVLNGELKTITATEELKISGNAPSDNTLYKATLNEKGQVTKIEAATGAKYYQVQANGTAKGGVLGIDSAAINGTVSDATYVTYNDSTTVYFIHTDSKTVNTGSMESVKDNAQIYVKTSENANSAKGYTVSVAYVLVDD